MDSQTICPIELESTYDPSDIEKSFTPIGTLCGAYTKGFFAEEGEDIQNKIQCKSCNQIFFQKSYLDYHYERMPMCKKFADMEHKPNSFTEPEEPRENEICDKNEVTCNACFKVFTAKSSLKRHHERNPVCVKWNSLEPSLSVNDDVSIIEFIENIKNKITSTNGYNSSCKYCGVIYSNFGNLNKHYKTSVACNRLAYVAFKDEVGML